jgi:two-component system LytT family sensor kinase
MALHLSHHAAGGEPVASELLGHHASLPLALVILYQDYRFALADLFLKRALSAVLLVAVALAGYLAVAAVATPELARDPSDPRRTGAVLALIVAIALCYPLMRRLVHGFVDRVVLRRADYASLRASIVARIAPLESTTAVLDAVCEALAPAMSAGQVRWSEVPAAAGMAGSMTGDQTTHWTDARHLVAFVPVVTAEEPTYEITVAELRGGRRLLSDDLALLDAVAVAAARRIDAVRVAQERLEREAREHEVTRLAVEAELRALRAQLNPHFLFNALTTVGYLVQVAPDRALATLLRLTELLRAVLRPTAGELVSLAEELEIVTAYLAIEQARFEERLRVTVDVSDDARAVRVPALLVQPLVENAVKHGIAPQRAGGDVIVWARVEADGEGGSTPTLHLSVADSGVGVSPEELARRRASGVGLSSVERRVAGVYAGAGRVSIRSAPGVGTSVELWLPVSCTPVAVPPNATSPLRKVG